MKMELLIIIILQHNYNHKFQIHFSMHHKLSYLIVFSISNEWQYLFDRRWSLSEQYHYMYMYYDKSIDIYLVHIFYLQAIPIFQDIEQKV